MEVLVFARHFPILSEGFVQQQCEGLLDLGVSLTILADGPYGDGMNNSELASDALMKRVHYHHIPSAGTARLFSVLRWLVSSRSITWRRRLSLLNPLRVGPLAAAMRLPFQAETLSSCPAPDLLHAHFGPIGAMVAALRLAGIVQAPLITTYYGYDVSKDDLGTSKFAYRRLFAIGDLHLVLSNVMRQRLEQMGASADRIAVHRLGVDLSCFQPSFSPPQPFLRVLSIARLVPKKGIDDSLRAVAAAAAQMRLHYTIVGDGPCRAEWEALAVSLGIADKVSFLGWRVRSEVVELLKQTDVLLVPSVTAPNGDAEGTPVVILEAQAMGVPVIATRHAGNGEILAEGESGLLVDEHDWSGMKDYLLELTNPPRRRTMGEAGRAFVELHHDSRRLSKQLLEHYHSVITQKVK